MDEHFFLCVWKFFFYDFIENNLYAFGVIFFFFLIPKIWILGIYPMSKSSPIFPSHILKFIAGLYRVILLFSFFWRPWYCFPHEPLCRQGFSLRLAWFIEFFISRIISICVFFSNFVSSLNTYRDKFSGRPPVSISNLKGIIKSDFWPLIL